MPPNFNTLKKTNTNKIVVRMHTPLETVDLYVHVNVKEVNKKENEQEMFITLDKKTFFIRTSTFRKKDKIYRVELMIDVSELKLLGAKNEDINFTIFTMDERGNILDISAQFDRNLEDYVKHNPSFKPKFRDAIIGNYNILDYIIGKEKKEMEEIIKNTKNNMIVEKEVLVSPENFRKLQCKNRNMTHVLNTYVIVDGFIFQISINSSKFSNRQWKLLKMKNKDKIIKHIFKTYVKSYIEQRLKLLGYKKLDIHFLTSILENELDKRLRFKKIDLFTRLSSKFLNSNQEDKGVFEKDPYTILSEHNSSSQLILLDDNPIDSSIFDDYIKDYSSVIVQTHNGTKSIIDQDGSSLVSKKEKIQQLSRTVQLPKQELKHHKSEKFFNKKVLQAKSPKIKKLLINNYNDSIFQNIFLPLLVEKNFNFVSIFNYTFPNHLIDNYLHSNFLLENLIYRPIITLHIKNDTIFELNFNKKDNKFYLTFVEKNFNKSFIFDFINQNDDRHFFFIEKNFKNYNFDLLQYNKDSKYKIKYDSFIEDSFDDEEIKVSIQFNEFTYILDHNYSTITLNSDNTSKILNMLMNTLPNKTIFDMFSPSNKFFRLFHFIKLSDMPNHNALLNLFNID